MSARKLGVDALKWYVKEDDVIESMAGNEPWVEGKRRGEEAIVALESDIARVVEPIFFVTKECIEWLEFKKRFDMKLQITGHTYSFGGDDQPLYVAPQEAAAPAWIAVSERLPENCVDVQVYCDNTKEQFTAFRMNSGLFQFAQDPSGRSIFCNPSHWMPLQPAPGSAAITSTPAAPEPVNAVLLEALRRLWVSANTVAYCYDKSPKNFASALCNLKNDAESASAAIAKAGGAA